MGTTEEKALDRSLSPEMKSWADNALNGGATGPSPYWTGPWPLLHIPVELFVESCYAFFEIVIDLLMSVEVAALTMSIPNENGVSQSQIDTTMSGLLVELLGAWGGLIGALAMTLRIGLSLIDTISLIPHRG